MNIAHISYEYPPDTGVGGIATYVDQVSKVLDRRGHTIHVFCASPSRSSDEHIGHLSVHRIRTEDRQKFKWLISEKFIAVHNNVRFDLLESPEFNADGLIIKKILPDLPLVVRLHTPSFLINRLNYGTAISKAILIQKIYRAAMIYRAIRGSCDSLLNPEYEICTLADCIHSPSVSLAEICLNRWKLNPKKLKVIPNVFQPSQEFLKIPPVVGSSQKIFFFGRLERRKGILIFEKIIPKILREFPLAEFHFIGKSLLTPSGELFDQYLKRKCRKWVDRMFFRQVVYEEIPSEMAKADICLFPSIWENFPNVCLEAMSAGRAIIASNQGGMKDMLEDEDAGILVDPDNHKQIISKILELFTKPALIGEYGMKARHAVLKKYNENSVGELVEQEFQRLTAVNKHTME